MKNLVTASFHRNLDLLLQVLDLIECVIELHLKVVTLEDHRFKMHLLPPNYILFESLALFLDLLKLLLLFWTALKKVWHLAKNFLGQLQAILEVALALVCHVLKHVDLLLQIMVLLFKLLPNFDLLRRDVTVDLLEHKHL